MKKLLFHSAMLAMIFAAAVMATSCQKEKEKEEITEKTVSHFNPENLQIEDMNAYLEGFKEKMENAEAKGETEMMGIEEAAWHLSSVANHDFAQLNAPHNDIRFDTLYCHVDVTEGMISLTDMCSLYEEMSNAIVGFKKSLGSEDPNFWFIDTRISENGDVIIPLITMFINGSSKYWGDHYWYLNSNTADSICALYLDSSTPYYADSNAVTTLEYILTLTTTTAIPENGYLTASFSHTFYYQNHEDPYISNFYGRSRLYASTNTYHRQVGYYNMCYAFDSYAGLVNTYIDGIRIAASIDIEFVKGTVNESGKGPQVGNHVLTVLYGQIAMHGQGPGGGGNN